MHTCIHTYVRVRVRVHVRVRVRVSYVVCVCVCQGNSALILACQNNHKKVVKVSLLPL